jgi:intracellular multiplication protein IcmP
MAQQQGGGQQQGADNAYTPIWIMVGIFAVAFLVWHFFKVQIISFAFYINLVQAKVISLFTSSIDNDIYIMETVDPRNVDLSQLLALLRLVGDYMRYPLSALLIGFAVWLYLSNVTLKYKRTHTMNSLREQEQENWNQIMPVTKHDIVSASIDEGIWAMARSPMDFAKDNKLLKKDDLAAEDPKHVGIALTAGVKRGEAKAIFTLQLGPAWSDFEQLPMHLLALAAIFSARINQDRDGAYSLLDTINQSALKGKMSYMGAKVLMKKHKNTEIVQKCAQRHAYNLTVLASLLEKGRDDGVLASCDFIWLRLIDRRAWYMLNSVGRQTPFAEVAGTFAHWKAEKVMERKSVVPMVDEAIKALENAVKEVKLPPAILEAL